MEKIITIDGQEVKFKSTGATPLRYKAQFGEDFFSAIAELGSVGKLTGKKANIEDLKKVNFDTLYNICWVLAKTADKEIPTPMEWLDGFDSFPIMDILPELTELITSSIEAKKK